MIINDMLKLFKVIIQSLIISRRRLFNKGKKKDEKNCNFVIHFIIF